MNKVRLLTAREIECRIQQVKQNGLSLLLYKDARCDMNILDETFGPMNWKREHSRENRNCTVSLWDDEKKQWVGKEDTGTESNTEAEKGLASDSFKRACVNWGIGRELYTAPFIWVPADKCQIVNGKCYDRFDVAKIEYNENREICALEIVNEKTGAVVYRMGQKAQEAQKPASKDEYPLNCVECRGVITPWMVGKEMKMTASQVMDYTIGKYGVPLCVECAGKRKAAK